MYLRVGACVCDACRAGWSYRHGGHQTQTNAHARTHTRKHASMWCKPKRHLPKRHDRFVTAPRRQASACRSSPLASVHNAGSTLFHASGRRAARELSQNMSRRANTAARQRGTRRSGLGTTTVEMVGASCVSQRQHKQITVTPSCWPMATAPEACLQ